MNVPAEERVLNTEETKGSSICFRGRPLPKCRSFLLTELSYSHRFDAQPNNSYSSSSANYYFTWEIGWMKNLKGSSALGATLFLGADDDGARFGLKTRYRRWLNRTTSLDLSPGILLLGSNNQFEPSFPGFTGHAGLNFGDWFALIIQVEAIYLDTVGTDVGWYGGFKLGSYPGLIGGVASFILVIIAYSTVTVM